MTPRLSVPVSKLDHAQGPATAPVTLVEYGDFECPHCRAAHAVVKEIQQRLGPKLRFVFRNFPLTMAHPHAQQAAEAAEAAGTQGKFWRMHDVLFENQEALEDADLVQIAAALNLDTDEFADALGNHVHARRVREDFMSGVRSGVNGTPSFFVNGVMHDGWHDFTSLLASIENRLETITSE
jgi:protein-disulfide isomerase